MAPITIRGNTFDPANPGKVELPQDASKLGYILVQLKAGLDAVTMKDLEKAKVKVVKRMCENNWLCNYHGANLSAVTSIVGVQHAVLYLPLFRLHFNLKGPVPSGSEKSEVTVTIVLHEDVTKPGDALIAIKKLSTKVLAASGYVINAEIPWQNLEVVAKINQIQAIERLTPIAPNNNRIREIIQLDAVNKWLNQKKDPKFPELTGLGQTVAVVDTGVDPAHKAFNGRIGMKLSYPKQQKPDPQGEDYNGHGTHVAGTVLGSTLTVDDQDVRGMASKAKLIIQRIPLGSMAKNFQFGSWTVDEVIKDAYDNGARVQNHSWGSSMDEKNPEQLDYGIANAEIVDREALARPDMLVVFAAGNDGGKSTKTGAQIGSYAAAKNALTVGACYTDRPRVSDHPDVIDRVDYINGQRENLNTPVSFSSRGPVTKTKRLKPDLVAPGVCILSAKSSVLATEANMETWAKRFGKVPTSWGQNSGELVFCSGTSMAAPAVSGCAAVIREAFGRYYPKTTLSAPLLKALLINGADVLTGDRTQEGFGRVNMWATLEHLSHSLNDIRGGKADRGFWQDAMDSSKKLTTHLTTVPKPKSEDHKMHLRVTLAYHDLPGDEIQNFIGLALQRKGDAEHQKLRAYKFDAANPQLEWNNVQRVSAIEVKPGDQWEIHVVQERPILRSSLWGLAWTYLERAPGDLKGVDLAKL